MMPVHVLTYDRSTNTVDSDTIVGHTWVSSGDNGVYKPDSAMATSGTNPGAINDLSVPDGHNLTDLVADEDDYLHFIGAGHNAASLYLMSSSPGDSTSWNFQSYNQNWIGYGVEKKTTYPSLAICPDTGNLYYTARATVRSGDAGLFANTDRHRGVLFMRKLRTGPGTYSDWEDMGVLTFSHTPGYSSFTQNVSVDNKGSIYINYRFHSPDNNTANPGGNSFIQAYQDEAILRFPEMTDPNDSIGYDPVSLVSHDYGLTFHLTTTADFFANIDKPDFAPSGVSASLVSLSAVTVAWTDASSNESGFRVERQASGGDWTVLADTAAGVETYTDNTMAVGGSYTYRVQALAAGLNSPYALSNTVAVSAYAVWQLMYPGVGIGSADDDADGLDNNTEYLFGSDPLDGGNQARILLGINAAYPEITYTRRSDDATYVIQTSTDLLAWGDASMTPISLVLNADGTETVTYQSLIDYSTESAIFFRVGPND